jgi:hypothetical protein
VRQAGGGGVAGQGEERDEASAERSWSWLRCAEEDDEGRQRGDKVGRFVGPTYMWCAFKAVGAVLVQCSVGASGRPRSASWTRTMRSHDPPGEAQCFPCTNRFMASFSVRTKSKPVLRYRPFSRISKK